MSSRLEDLQSWKDNAEGRLAEAMEIKSVYNGRHSAVAFTFSVKSHPHPLVLIVKPTR